MTDDAVRATDALTFPGGRAVVWFKRDLRLHDHAPLHQAQRAGAALGLVIIEPQWLSSPECHPRQVDWLLKCLAPLARALAERGMPLLVRHGEAVQVLAQLRAQFDFTHLLSHEETGPGWSYARDKAVAHWCRLQGVHWQEWPQSGVVRRLKERRGWASRWQQRMDAPMVPRPLHFKAPSGWLSDDALPALRALGLSDPGGPQPAAGEAAAHEGLARFLDGRARGYRRNLSSPLSAEEGCSRLSAHLAYGTISMRQVHQLTEQRIKTSEDRALAHDLRGFAARLRWHCHFIQKLEDEPDIEWRNFARSADGLRPGDGLPMDSAAEARLQAWMQGRTGYPMVDACMRQLCATGWLNFRMRALLVSFASYHLWLHWRAPGLFLARQFLDFEPGIHWSQMQMQSGTTGINTLRIYSPSKQAADHDPQGLYIRRWIPEYGSADYPAPIVDEREAMRAARERLYPLRRSGPAREEAQKIQERHGSRKSGLPPSGKSGRPPAGRRAPARATARPAQEDEDQGRLF